MTNQQIAQELLEVLGNSQSHNPAWALKEVLEKLREKLSGTNEGVDVIEEHQLDEYICAAAEIIANEEGYGSVSEYIKESTLCMGETLVICEIVGELKGKNVDNYILDVLKAQEEKENKEEYELYLKLKEKFEK